VGVLCGRGRRAHAVVGAVEGQRGHGDRRLQGQRRLDVCERRTTRHQAEAVAVGVDHHGDEIGVAKSRRAAFDRGLVEVPGW
jgi:hypothetical protein